MPVLETLGEESVCAAPGTDGGLSPATLEIVAILHTAYVFGVAGVKTSPRADEQGPNHVWGIDRG